MGSSLAPNDRHFPCCARSSSAIHAVANIPVQPLKYPLLLTFSSIRFSRIDWQVILYITLFGACSAFAHITACMLAKSPRDPLHRRLQPVRYLHDCSNYFRLEQISPGGIRTHWKSGTLSWRTSNSGCQDVNMADYRPPQSVALQDYWANLKIWELSALVARCNPGHPI